MTNNPHTLDISYKNVSGWVGNMLIGKGGFINTEDKKGVDIQIKEKLDAEAATVALEDVLDAMQEKNVISVI